MKFEARPDDVGGVSGENNDSDETKKYLQPDIDSLENNPNEQEQKYFIGGLVYVDLPSTNPFKGCLAEISEIDNIRKKVKVGFYLFGRLNPNSLEFDFKDIRWETDEEIKKRNIH